MTLAQLGSLEPVVPAVVTLKNNPLLAEVGATIAPKDKLAPADQIVVIMNSVQILV